MFFYYYLYFSVVNVCETVSLTYNSIIHTEEKFLVSIRQSLLPRSKALQSPEALGRVSRETTKVAAGKVGYFVRTRNSHFASLINTLRGISTRFNND